MNPEMFDRWRIIPRLLILMMMAMTWNTLEWFMALPDPDTQQASLVSVMTGALTGAFGLFLGSGKKE
jgi:hypothetical protein